MRKLRILLVVALLAFCGAVAAAAPWQVGLAKTEITPQSPVWMAGYAARTHPSEGTVHPLWAKVLVIDGEGRRVAIVTADLIGFTRDVSDAIARRVARQTGLERGQIVFNASHTHCGPVVLGCADIAHHMEADDVAAAKAYREWLVERVVETIVRAAGAMRPAILTYGEGEATFASNRRARRGKDFVISPNAAGPVDHVVPVLRIGDESGKPLAVLFGYACHNTTLGGDFYQFNGDYAGFAQIDVEARHPGVTAMFMAGCGADSNPQPRGQLELAEAHGKALGAAVDEVLSKDLAPIAGPITVAMERVDLPFVDPPTKEELEAGRGQGTVYQQRLTELLLKRIAEQGHVDRAYPYPVQVVRFGDDLTLVALAGEVVVDYALRLRKEYEGKRLWIAGYSNEVFAYLPSERILTEGGYEGGGAMVYFGWHGPFRPGVEDLVVGLTKKLVDGGK